MPRTFSLLAKVNEIDASNKLYFLNYFHMVEGKIVKRNDKEYFKPFFSEEEYVLAEHFDDFDYLKIVATHVTDELELEKYFEGLSLEESLIEYEITIKDSVSIYYYSEDLDKMIIKKIPIEDFPVNILKNLSTGKQKTIGF